MYSRLAANIDSPTDKIYVGEIMEKAGDVRFKNYGNISGNEIDKCENGIGYSSGDGSGIVGGVFISVYPGRCGMQIKISLDGTQLAFRGWDFNHTLSNWKMMR